MSAKVTSASKDKATKASNEKLAKAFTEYIKYGESGRHTTNEVIRAVVESILGTDEANKIIEDVKANQERGGLNISQ